MRTGFLYDSVFLEHDTGAGHPECPQRLSYGFEYLSQQQWFSSLHSYQAKIAERNMLQLVHSDTYIERARQSCAAGESHLDSMDVAICDKSYDIALQATGSLLHLADEIMADNIDNAFAMIRPPGHHAEAEQAMGFCLFNNVAILARYLQQQYGLDKILIVDWDVHHGNGTQHLFETDPSVLYISTHQYPFYPGTGAAAEEGNGRGKGATLNCPMPAGCGDSLYEQAFRERILPKIDDFKPEYIIISAGFDAHRDDPLANINLSTDCFAWMTKRLLEKADQHCAGRLISALEGGYHLQKLADCMTKHIAVLSANEHWGQYP